MRELESRLSASSKLKCRMVWAAVVSLLGVACSQPTNAQDDPYRFKGLAIALNGWTLADTSPDGTAVLYRGPITSPARDIRRIWERWEYPKEMSDVQPPYRSDVQLIEVKCSQRRMHSLQRDTFSDNNINTPTGWTTSDASEWNYVPPGTMAEDMLNLACSVGATNGVPSGATLVDFVQIRRAAHELHRQMDVGGMSAATTYSTECFERFHRKPSWSDFDICVAFDDLAGALDAGVSKMLGTPTIAYFSEKTRLARAERSIRLVSSNNENSLEHIYRINGQATLDLDEIDWSTDAK